MLLDKFFLSCLVVAFGCIIAIVHPFACWLVEYLKQLAWRKSSPPPSPRTPCGFKTKNNDETRID